jgi:hypothetical protein
LIVSIVVPPVFLESAGGSDIQEAASGFRVAGAAGGDPLASLPDVVS